MNYVLTHANQAECLSKIANQSQGTISFHSSISIKMECDPTGKNINTSTIGVYIVIARVNAELWQERDNKSWEERLTKVFHNHFSSDESQNSSYGWLHTSQEFDSNEGTSRHNAEAISCNMRPPFVPSSSAHLLKKVLSYLQVLQLSHAPWY